MCYGSYTCNNQGYTENQFVLYKTACVRYMKNAIKVAILVKDTPVLFNAIRTWVFPQVVECSEE